MKYYVFRLSWSQTDQGYCVVEAATEHQAREKVKANARYVDCIAIADRLIR